MLNLLKQKKQLYILKKNKIHQNWPTNRQQSEKFQPLITFQGYRLDIYTAILIIIITITTIYI